MNRKTLATVVIIGAVTVAGAILPRALAQAGHGTGHSGNMGGMNMKQPAKAEGLSLGDIHSRHVPMVVMSTLHLVQEQQPQLLIQAISLSMAQMLVPVHRLTAATLLLRPVMVTIIILVVTLHYVVVPVVPHRRVVVKFD